MQRRPYNITSMDFNCRFQLNTPIYFKTVYEVLMNIFFIIAMIKNSLYNFLGIYSTTKPLCKIVIP